MGQVAKTLVGGAALAGADYYATGGQVAAGMYNAVATATNTVASGVNSLMQGAASPVQILSPTAAANINAAPILGTASGLATGATGIYSLYRGYNKTKEHGIIRGTQEASLAFGTISGLTALAGLTATTSLTAPALAVGAGIWGARQIVNGGKTFFEAPVANVMYGVKTPFRWTGKAYHALTSGFKKAS